jgi:hypothetical protein
MTKKIFLTALTSLFCLAVFSQTPTHRVRFKYRIKQSEIAALTARGIILRDGTTPVGNLVNICNNTRVLKCLITNNNGLLTIDPWAISDPSVNPATTTADPCLATPGVVKATTPYPLTIDIRRGFTRAAGTSVLVGHPTEAVTFHYQTWLIGVNTSAVKFRPSVKDYNGNEYSANAITGTINAGLTIGYSFGWTTFTHRSTTSWSVTPAFSLGLASASLAKEPLKKQVTTTYNPSNFIISPALGFIVARNDVGIFFTYGHDFMTGKNSDAWAYQGKHFFGIGLSAGFKL